MLPPIPGLTTTKQAFLDVIVAEAIDRGEWEFPFNAVSWCQRVALPDEDKAHARSIIYRLDAATNVLRERGFLTLVKEGDHEGGPRIWRVNPGAIRAAVTPTESKGGASRS